MMSLYQQSTIEERERILATFKAGRALCLSALSTLLYAIATFLLVVVHILTFAINFTIGVLMILHAVGCMARLLLVQCQELTANQLNTIGGRDRW
jgi:hypothetical protein